MTKLQNFILYFVAACALVIVLSSYGFLHRSPELPKQAVMMPAKFEGAPMLWTGRLRLFVLVDSLPFTIGKQVFYQPVLAPGPGDTIPADSLGVKP